MFYEEIISSKNPLLRRQCVNAKRSELVFLLRKKPNKLDDTEDFEPKTENVFKKFNLMTLPVDNNKHPSS